MMFAMGYPSENARPNAWHFKRMPPENSEKEEQLYEKASK